MDFKFKNLVKKKLQRLPGANPTAFFQSGFPEIS